MKNTHNNEFGHSISQIIQPMKEGASTEKQEILEEIASRLESGYHSVIENLANKGYLEYLSKAELKAVF